MTAPQRPATELAPANGKHDLEEKLDNPVIKKLSSERVSPRPAHNSLNSLMNAAASVEQAEVKTNGDIKQEAPHPQHPVVLQATPVAPAPPVEAAPAVASVEPVQPKAPTVAAENAPAPPQAPVAPIQNQAGTPAVTVLASAPPVAPAPAPVPASEPSPANGAAPENAPVAVPQFSSNVTGKEEQKDTSSNGNEEEEVEEKKDEVVEPPMRKVEEDENYDDE